LAISFHTPRKNFPFLLILFIHWTSNGIAAQQLSSGADSLSGTDTAYIADYKNLLTARVFLLYQDASFVLNPNTSEKIIYSPNVSGRIGIAGFYKWFGLGISFGNSIFRRSATKYGNTSVLDLRVNAYGRSVAAELYLQNLKGFYIRNLKDTLGDFFKIPDMKIFALGFIGYYIYNHERFSIRSAFIQNERQKKSAGSFILRPTFLYYNLSSVEGIVPVEIIATYGIKNNFLLKKGEFYSFGLAPGYAYTLVFFKKAYLNAALFPGILWQNYHFEANGESYSSANFTFTLSWRAALGYNTNTWYIGAAIVSGFDKIPGWIGNSTFYYDIGQVRFWVGTRFNWFKKKK
jgi:Domain of unknown function (DUF4421)